jgi:hypothetical protein
MQRMLCDYACNKLKDTVGSPMGSLNVIDACTASGSMGSLNVIDACTASGSSLVHTCCMQQLNSCIVLCLV